MSGTRFYFCFISGISDFTPMCSLAVAVKLMSQHCVCVCLNLSVSFLVGFLEMPTCFLSATLSAVVVVVVVMVVMVVVGLGLTTVL